MQSWTRFSLVKKFKANDAKVTLNSGNILQWKLRSKKVFFSVPYSAPATRLRCGAFAPIKREWMKNDRKKCMRKLFLGWLLSFAQVSINDLRVCNNVRGWWGLGLRPSFQIFPYLIVIQEKYLKLSIFCSWEQFENSKMEFPGRYFSDGYILRQRVN